MRALTFAALLMLAAPSFAKAAPPEADVPAERFFSALRAGDVAKAYSEVGRGTLMDQKKVEMQNVTNQTASMLQLYGKIVDWELMSEKAWSPSYLSRNYLVRTERGPIFFNLHLYRSPSGWVMVTFYFTDIPKNLPTN